VGRVSSTFAVLRGFVVIASSDDTAIIVPNQCLEINISVNEFGAAM